MLLLSNSLRLWLLLWTTILSFSSRMVVVVTAFEYPVPNLPLSDINIVIVTDVHSWVGGYHKLHEGGAADYGHVLSFVEHLRNYCNYYNGQNNNHHDLWLVMNGDWIDGTGLALNGDPSFLIPILEQMHFDSVNVGNHELYKNQVIQYMTRPAGLVELLGDRYLSSNVVHSDTQEPLGHRYHILKGNHNLLLFGFLYNMEGYDTAVTVQTVETTVQASWFKDILQDRTLYDAIAVLAHMNVRDELVHVILQAIRNYNPHVAILFVTGHTHRRDYESLDESSVSVESGRYLDTIGFVSIRVSPDGTTTTPNNVGPSAIDTNTNSTMAPTLKQQQQPPVFHHQFIDADIEVLADTLGLSAETFPTSAGLEQSALIQRTRNELGLNQVIGCTNQHYHLNRSLYETDSLWAFFVETVVPARFSGDQILLLSNGVLRADLYKGTVYLDDAIGVSPYNSSLVVWEHSIPGTVIVDLNKTLSEREDTLFALPLPSYILAPAEPFQENQDFSLIIDSFGLNLIQEQLDILFPDGAAPKPILLDGVTTTSIWIDFFKENSHSCGGFNDWFHPNGHGQPGSPNPAADTFRLIFVGLAIMVVLALGTMMVYQKGVVYRREVSAQELATLEAMREYESGNYDGDSYHDEVEELGYGSEGELI